MSHDRLGVRRLERRDVGRNEVNVALPLTQCLHEPGQLIRRVLRLDLPPGPHGTFDAIPPDCRHQLRGLLGVELLKWLREANEREAGQLTSPGHGGLPFTQADRSRNRRASRQQVSSGKKRVLTHFGPASLIGLHGTTSHKKPAYRDFLGSGFDLTVAPVQSPAGRRQDTDRCSGPWRSARGRRGAGDRQTMRPGRGCSTPAESRQREGRGRPQ